MSEESPAKNLVDQFILEEIESVPHLEALLLFWRHRPRSWTLLELSNALYLDAASTRLILDDMTRRGLASVDEGPECWKYAEGHGKDALIEQVTKTYQAELIRISRMIHSKQSTPVREFAKAFRFNQGGG